MIELLYIHDTNEIEVISEYNLGFPEYYKFQDLEVIDANERELGVEIEYILKRKNYPNIHIVFYPEGILNDFWEE